MFCGECGAKQDADAVFCGMCGNAIEHADIATDGMDGAWTEIPEVDTPRHGGSAERGPKLNRSFTPWLLVLSVVALAGALVVIGWRVHWPHAVFASSQSSTTTLPPTTTTEPTTTTTTTQPSGGTTSITAPPTTSVVATTTTSRPVPKKPPPLITYASAAVRSNPYAVDVAGTFQTYFGGVNARNFARAYSAYSPRARANFSLAGFIAGDRTSRITHVVIHSVTANPDGSVTAEVTFTSHQAPALGPVPGETCADFHIVYQMVPSADGNLSYLIDLVDKPLSGQHPC